MAFVFQQPGSAKLLEAVSEYADGADSGVAVFAFASAGGVKSFFGVQNVANMLSANKPFHLVVGIDAITNADALLSILDIKRKYGANVTAEVFFHQNPASTFHPKFVQFRKGKELRLITGSGNLTARGLGQVSANAPAPGNWEAFSRQLLSGADAKAVAHEVTTWLHAMRAGQILLPPTDERVKSRAMANGLVRYTTRPAPPATPNIVTPVAAVEPDDVPFDADDILIRELPKNRTGQADVGKDVLSDFFGYAGRAKNILLQHVSLGNHIGPTESIRLFVNDSKNYRLELHAMGGLPYDIAADDSRMILVATKLDQRSFRYTIVPVSSPEHAKLVALLGSIGTSRRFMRGKRLKPLELKQAWDTAPLGLVPVLAETPPP